MVDDHALLSLLSVASQYPAHFAASGALRVRLKDVP